VFLAATGKTLGPGLEAQATAFIRCLSKCLRFGLPKTDSQKERTLKRTPMGLKRAWFHRAKLAQGGQGIDAGQQKMRPVIFPTLPERL
jgi:hypothetical protein